MGITATMQHKLSAIELRWESCAASVLVAEEVTFHLFGGYISYIFLP